MKEYAKPPPVGSNTFTQLIYETCLPRGRLSIEVLSGLLAIQRFYVIEHLWTLKLGGKHQDVLDRVTGVSYDRIPAGMRSYLLPQQAPEVVVVPTPPPVVAPTPEPIKPAPQSEPVTTKETSMKKYGRIAGRMSELVNYVRSNPPKTVAQLGRVFGVESSTLRTYLYGLIHAKVNLDVPRKVIWASAGATEPPPSVLATLSAHPLSGLVEYPTQTDQAPKPKRVNSTVDTLERLALENLRAGNIEAVQALGAALRVVEKGEAK